VANASIATGVYETFNNFASVPPDYPTVFEYFRKDLKRPASDAWVVAPSNGFNLIGQVRAVLGLLSERASFCPSGCWPRIESTGLSKMEHLLHDNLRNSDVLSGTGRERCRIAPDGGDSKLSVDIFTAHARNLESPDELSVYIARQLMRQVAPSILWITLHDIDIAHSGTFSLYVDAIQRSDRLCAEIWNASRPTGIRGQNDAGDFAGLRPGFRHRSGW